MDVKVQELVNSGQTQGRKRKADPEWFTTSGKWLSEYDTYQRGTGITLQPVQTHNLLHLMATSSQLLLITRPFMTNSQLALMHSHLLPPALRHNRQLSPAINGLMLVIIRATMTNNQRLNQRMEPTHRQ